MAINRRQFIKRSAGAVSVSLIMPRFGYGRAQAESRADPIEDLRRNSVWWYEANTVVPTPIQLPALRPTIGLRTRSSRRNRRQPSRQHLVRIQSAMGE